LGCTEYITDDFFGGVLSYIDYNAWGEPTNKATVMLGLRAVGYYSATKHSNTRQTRTARRYAGKRLV
jgi:hypothetical protein